MSELPWKPLRIGVTIDRQIDDAFRALIHSPWGLTNAEPNVWQPEIDLYETPDAYIVEADVPGVAPQDLQLLVERHALTISGSRASSGYQRSAQGLSLERRHGSFSRRFPLKHAVDPESVEHTCREGLHRIRLKKQD